MFSPTDNSPPPTPMETDTVMVALSPTAPAATQTPRQGQFMPLASAIQLQQAPLYRSHSTLASRVPTAQAADASTTASNASAPTITRAEADLLTLVTSQHDTGTAPKSSSVSAPPPGSRSTIHLITRPPAPPTRQRPILPALLTRLRFPLAPLHPLPTGPPHPNFPPTLLHYHLLTEPQLDSLATYYHQRPGPYSPSRFWTDGYPAGMRWDDAFLEWVGREKGGEERLRRKRRKLGRFIGLRDCVTPVEEVGERQEFGRGRSVTEMKGGDVFWGRRGL